MIIIYPINLKIENIRILIVGLGVVGFRKLQSILDCKNIKIVSKNTNIENIKFLEKYSNIQYFEKEYEKDDLKNIDMVFACTDDINVQNKINEDIKELSKTRFILSNICKIKEKSNFSNMSFIKKNDYFISINTDGKDCSKSKKLREQIEELLDE